MAAPSGLEKCILPSHAGGFHTSSGSGATLKSPHSSTYWSLVHVSSKNLRSRCSQSSLNRYLSEPSSEPFGTYVPTTRTPLTVAAIRRFCESSSSSGKPLTTSSRSYFDSIATPLYDFCP